MTRQIWFYCFKHEKAVSRKGAKHAKSIQNSFIDSVASTNFS